MNDRWRCPGCKDLWPHGIGFNHPHLPPLCPRCYRIAVTVLARASPSRSLEPLEPTNTPAVLDAIIAAFGVPAHLLKPEPPPSSPRRAWADDDG